MKERILEFLVCPTCQTDLTIEDPEGETWKIKSGIFHCPKCGVSYPVNDYVPRFVGTDKYVDTFSFEWNKFYDVQMDILNNTDESERTFKWKTGWKPEDLNGKLILDVGIGAGRFAEVVSKWGAEVVGVDLSFAVDAAYKNIGQRKNVHIIQTDLFKLPLEKEAFDYIYSIGVLHHSPDTEKAFKAIVPYLKKGGELAVFLYARGHYHYFSDMWRRITTKLPIKVMYYLSAIAVPLYYIHKIPFWGKAAQFLLPTANWPSWKWRWLDTFDWYTPKYQWKHTWPEVYKWFRDEGFTEIELFQEDRDSPLAQICMRGRKA